MKKIRRTVKTGVSFPRELLEDFDKILRELGIGSRSQGLQEAIRTFISVNSWKLEEGEELVGVILIHYSHEVKGLEEELTDIQHGHLHLILSTLHIHLTREDCLQIITVRGRLPEIRELTEEIRSKVKLKQLLPVLIPVH
ncbi:MAG: hypothetical protein QXK95_01140 [Nitrososphaerota archaeon]|nr:hypothetical protein [Candidatus Geocrenenecus dongiae]